mgnify:CR=1 FL=1
MIVGNAQNTHPESFYSSIRLAKITVPAVHRNILASDTLGAFRSSRACTVARARRSQSEKVQIMAPGRAV